jgi:hypothetical protein
MLTVFNTTHKPALTGRLPHGGSIASKKSWSIQSENTLRRYGAWRRQVFIIVHASCLSRPSLQQPRNVLFLSGHTDSNAIDTIVSPCQLTYVLGWNATAPWPKELPDLGICYYCCGLYEPSAKSVSELHHGMAEIAKKKVAQFPVFRSRELVAVIQLRRH